MMTVNMNTYLERNILKDLEMIDVIKTVTEQLTEYKQRITKLPTVWGYKQYSIMMTVYVLILLTAMLIGSDELTYVTVILIMFIIWLYKYVVNSFAQDKVDSINYEAKVYAMSVITKLFCQDKSWSLEYKDDIDYLPKNVSKEDCAYMIEAITGIDIDDIIINDKIIGKKGNNTFYYFNYGYMFTSRSRHDPIYVYGGEGLMLSLKKPIDGYLYIISDTLEKAGGFVGKGTQKAISTAIPNGNEIITMDNPEFEKYFVVRGEDKVLAHYILTPTLMENLVKLAKLHDTTTYIAFHKHWMFIALETQKNKFEFSLQNESVLSEIEKIDTELSDVLKVVETINLDMHEMNIHK